LQGHAAVGRTGLGDVGADPLRGKRLSESERAPLRRRGVARVNLRLVQGKQRKRGKSGDHLNGKDGRGGQGKLGGGKTEKSLVKEGGKSAGSKSLLGGGRKNVGKKRVRYFCLCVDVQGSLKGARATDPRFSESDREKNPEFARVPHV